MGPDHRKGLSGPCPERTCHSADRAEHVFLAGHLRLLRIENLARPAIGRPQPQDVLVAETGNRALDDGGTAAPLADLQRDRRREPRIGRLAHHRDHAANALIGEDVKERGLPQLDGQAQREGVIEHRIAGRVGEVAQHDGVGLGQFRRARSGERPVSSRDDGGKRGGGASPQRALRSTRRRRRDPRDGGGVLIGGALLPLQIGAKVRGRLIPELAILLERLQHDLFEAVGQIGSNGPQRRRLLMENRGPDDRTASRKRRTARRHFVQHQPEREEVRSRVDLFAAQLLRRHVGQRADRAARVGQERSGLEFRR